MKEIIIKESQLRGASAGLRGEIEAERNEVAATRHDQEREEGSDSFPWAGAVGGAPCPEPSSRKTAGLPAPPWEPGVGNIRMHERLT